MSLVQEFYRRDIDGLRALAVVAVVGYHAGSPGFGGGFVGVDVFFVLSGYLITSLLAGEAIRNGSVSLVDFYARRVRRLLPALFLMVAVTLLVGFFLLLPIFDEQQDLARSAIATALYVSNFYFFATAPGYFDPSADLKPLLHTWSLSVEEQFYIAWPATLIVLLRLSRAKPGLFLKVLLATVLFVLAVSLAWCLHATAARPMAAFFLLPSRAWELAAGSALAVVGPRIPAGNGVVGAAAALAGILLVVASVVALDDGMAFPGGLAVLPVAGTCLLIVAGIVAPGNPVTKSLSAQPLVWLGLLSYSWYLWHWPLLALARAVDLGQSSLARDAVIAVASLLPAYLSYRFVEAHIRFRRPGPFRRAETTLAAGAAISIILCAMAGGLGVWARHAAGAKPEFARLTAAVADRPPLRARCHQNPPFAGLANAESCIAGAHDAPVRLLLWGDSHADHLSPMMQAFAVESPQTPVLVRSFSGCTPMTQPFDASLAGYPACREFDVAVIAEVDRLSRSGLRGVVLAARWLRATEAAGDDRSLQSLERTVGELTRRGLRVLIVAPIPSMPFRGPVCLARRDANRCVMPRRDAEQAREAIMRQLTALSNRNPNVRIYDPIPDLCTPTLCAAERDGRVVFLDDRHLTATASRSLLPRASPLLEWVTGEGR